MQAGASINVTDQFLKTPLMYAAENNHESLVKYLLKIKADVNARVSFFDKYILSSQFF